MLRNPPVQTSHETWWHHHLQVPEHPNPQGALEGNENTKLIA